MIRPILTSGALLMLGMSALAPVTQATPLAEAAMNGDLGRVKSLLASHTADVNVLGPYETAPLHWVVRLDDVETASLLLIAGADPTLPNGHGVTPLSLAIGNGSPAMVKVLLEAGADPRDSDPTGESMLMQAAAVGVVENVQALLDAGAEVDTKDPVFEQTALMFAAREGHLDTVKLLLARGADPNARNKVGDPPPFIGPNSVPGFGFGIGIIRGGVPKDRGRREPQPGGMTPLLYAVRHNHKDIAEVLLDAGADLEQAEANDIFPLLMAISNQQVESALFLLERGAVIDRSDWYGRSPLWEAVNVRNLYLHNNFFENYVDRDAMLTVVKALLDKGADPNPRTKETPPFRHHLLSITGSLEWVDFTGQTPFLTAALSGDVTVMKLLLEHGADPHIATYEGTTALMAAAGVNWVVQQTFDEGEDRLLEAVKLCHELGMDINHANSMGLTAVHGAANRGSDSIIRYLVENGADLAVKDNEGRTPLDWAKGVFLATHPAEPKPSSIALIQQLMSEIQVSNAQ